VAGSWLDRVPTTLCTFHCTAESRRDKNLVRVGGSRLRSHRLENISYRDVNHSELLVLLPWNCGRPISKVSECHTTRIVCCVRLPVPHARFWTPCCSTANPPLARCTYVSTARQEVRLRGAEISGRVPQGQKPPRPCSPCMGL
jgi:hypothetical protein